MSNPPRTFHRIAPLVRHARSRMDAYDVVSFDVFDTLLVRRAHDPDALKMATARFIVRKARGLGITLSPEKVQRLRDKVEAMHRRRAGRDHPDYEACYPAFMADTLGILFRGRCGAALLQEVTDYELAIESAFLVPRAELVAWVDDLRRAGKKVVAISDMYLPAAHLRILLDRAGFEGRLDGVFSSADGFQAKASGAAWPMIARELGVDPSRWLHVGDNPISDGIRPSEFGIASLVLRDAGERFRYQLSRTYKQVADDRPYWRGRLAQQWMLPLEGENAKVSPLHVAGEQYFGPLLCAFVHHVAQRCLAAGVRRVYFLSREGEILRDLWRRIVPVLYAGEDRLPSDHYLYVSRKALAGVCCAHQGLSFEQARIAFLPASNRDFRDLCRIFDLDPEPLLPYLEKYGLKADTSMSRWHGDWHRSHHQRLARMLETCEPFQEEVRRQQRAGNEAFQRYLESEGFFDEGPVALVDIGWLGTIQRFLYEAVSHREDRPALHGHVLACSGGYPFPYADDNHLEGFFFDHKKFNFAGSLVLYAQDLFEETTRAAHAGLLGYRPDAEKGFALEFRSEDDVCSRNEREQSAYFEPLHQGLRTAADRYGPVAAVLGYEPEEWRPWLNAQSVNRMAFPRTREVALLTRIHHIDDFSARRSGPVRARKALLRLWTRPLWQLRCLPWLRPYHYLKHAIHWLRT